MKLSNESRKKRGYVQPLLSSIKPFAQDLVVVQSTIDIHDQQLGMRLRDAIASALTC